LPSYVFPGFPRFLEQAATELGRPESIGPARRITPLTALANLCAQAARADTAHVDGILAKAAEFRDHLATALRAAELMLAEVEAGRHPAKLEGLETGSFPRSEPRSGRKVARNERVPS
jgi:hypothetical protein